MGKAHSNQTNVKVRTLIKAYFVTHKNQEVTSSEIAEWINSNYFGLKTNVSARWIGRMISSERRLGSILYDIKIISKKPYKYMLEE